MVPAEMCGFWVVIDMKPDNNIEFRGELPSGNDQTCAQGCDEDAKEAADIVKVTDSGSYRLWSRSGIVAELFEVERYGVSLPSVLPLGGMLADNG